MSIEDSKIYHIVNFIHFGLCVIMYTLKPSYFQKKRPSCFQIMHLSPEIPTPFPTTGRREAYVGICKCLDDLQPPGGGGIVHFRQFIL